MSVLFAKGITLLTFNIKHFYMTVVNIYEKKPWALAMLLLTVEENDCRIHFSVMTKGEAIIKMTNAYLGERSGEL